MQDALSVLKEILKGGTVSYQAIFAKSLKSVPTAVFLSQGYFWQENALYRKDDEHREFDGIEYFSKTAVDWYEATGMSDEQQKTARERLIMFGILSEIKAGIPARLWFRIDVDAVVSVVTSFLNSRNQVSVKHGNSTPTFTETVPRETRKQYTVKGGNYYIESNREFIESNESIKKEVSDFSNLKNSENLDLKFSVKAEKKEKAPPRPPAAPQSETLTGPKVIEIPEQARVEINANGKQKTSKTRAEISDGDIAQHLKPNEQAFFAQVLANGAWPDYLQHRIEKDKFRYKSAKSAAQGVIVMIEAAQGDAEEAQGVVNQSRGKGWSGLFPIKKEIKNGYSNGQHNGNRPDLTSFHGGISQVFGNGNGTW